MAIIRNSILALFAVLGFMHCTDPIDVELDSAESLLAVDAWLDNLPQEQTIYLTWSQPYFDATTSAPVTDAIVEVTNSGGTAFAFTEVEAGVYRWSPRPEVSSLGEEGMNFQLSIDLGGRLYTSQSTLQGSPAIDEIRQEFRDDEIGREDGIWTEFFARDLPGLGNTYWIKTFKNGAFLNKPDEINIAYDAAFDAGAQIDGLIFIPPIREFINPIPDPDDDADLDPAPWSPGDNIRVEIHSLNKEVFFFMETLRDQILNGNNGIFATPLVNTRGNVISQSGETVLGVFNVASISSLEATIE